MVSRFFTVLLILLTVGFFVFRHIQQQYAKVSFASIVAPANFTDESFMQDEFLLLMDQGDEAQLDDVLSQFDLEVVAPLGEWVHVRKTSADGSPRIMSLRVPQAQQELAMVDELEQHEAIHSATLNYRLPRQALSSCRPFFGNQGVSTETLPHDPLFKHQWYLTKESGVDIIGAWKITTGDERTVIAVVDRNFDVKETDLSPQRCSSRRYYYKNILDIMSIKQPVPKDDRSRHGSQVLSVIAPCTDNDVGLAGIDWHAQVFMVDSRSDASLSARMFALLWAAGIDICSTSVTACPSNVRFQRNQHPANVINTSFGFAGPALEDPPYGPVLDVIGRINREGRMVIASAGNESGLADRRLPGAAGGVISVGASNRSRQSSGFSNYGKTVDVVAPGEEIIGINRNRPISLNGTSFSAPIVAGVASLMLDVNPDLGWKAVEHILKATAAPMTCDAYCPATMPPASLHDCRSYCCVSSRSICSNGIIDAQKAVSLAQEGILPRALVDVDDYYVALSSDNGLEAKIIVKNWGGKPGVVRLKKTDPNLLMTPSTVAVEAIGRQGVPGYGFATIKYKDPPRRPVVASLILEIANQNTPTLFHDQIEAIVEIVPDGVRGEPDNKKRLLRELSGK